MDNSFQFFFTHQKVKNIILSKPFSGIIISHCTTNIVCIAWRVLQCTVCIISNIMLNSRCEDRHYCAWIYRIHRRCNLQPLFRSTADPFWLVVSICWSGWSRKTFKSSSIVQIFLVVTNRLRCSDLYLQQPSNFTVHVPVKQFKSAHKLL